ncbi:Z1 domain-containing protein [Bifidobacterium moukalabense]|uniref:Z1 domain-containing protein n=1 Tax=Bifidobacterium moukalabense TaxID=1333651 RepID=UPI001359CF89|nr:Z1 domain-containing protein [Bifidobacterium moukalabense]
MWKPWFPDLQADEKWDTPRSTSYYQYLIQDRDSEYATLDHTANEVIELLSDPRRTQPPVRRKGLILGDVQSGKTRTYIALMHKAADCGYKLIVVLTSDNENLRQQTQTRIDTDFIGYHNGRQAGVGRYLAMRNVPRSSPLTNDNDFVKAYEGAFKNLARPTWSAITPYVAVIKKNASILSKFNRWLKNPEFDSDLPVLVIDDESDYASVNSAKVDNEPTRINRLIRELTMISSRTSYVAVTATPFANIFIDDEIEEDLFPQDFIHILQSPNEYIGAKKLFGDMDTKPENFPCVQELDEEDLETWLPVTHRKTFDIVDPGLHEAVKYAIDCFVIACCLRPNADACRQSMLIHMSRFTEVQRQIADRVYDYVCSLEKAVRFHSQDDPRVERLHCAFVREYECNWQTGGQTWEKFYPRVRRFVLSGRLRVRLVNSDAAEWSLQHNVLDDPSSNECTLFVGGNQLSRGMTLDGLICSVFYRRVTASDTLLQMGRWFGYRPHYAQLQRIWMLPQSVLDYRYSCSIVEELKQSAQHMKRQGMTPKQFGLAIRKNPNRGVRITNVGKMRNAEEGEQFQEFDLSGEIIESIKLTVDGKQLERNDRALEELLRGLHAPGVVSGESPMAHTQVFTDVPAKAIVDFLTGYKAGYGDKFGFTVFTYPNRDIEWDSSLVERYAKTQMEENPSITWNVTFINGEGGKVENPDDLDFAWKKVVRKSSYNPDKGYFQINDKRMRLGSRTDVLKVARFVYDGTIDDQSKSERDYYLTEYFGNHPSLLLYRVQVKSIKGWHQNLVPEDGPGLLAAKLIVPVDRKDTSHRLGKAVYVYNTVAQRNEYERLRQEEAYGQDEDD